MTAACLFAGGALAFVAIAFLWLPWLPAPEVSSNALAEELFTSGHLAQVAEYSAGARLWSWSSLALGLVWLIAVAIWSGSDSGRSTLSRVRGPWWFSATVVVVVVLALQRLITLPLAYMHWRNRVDHGLAGDAWLQWASDVVRGWGVASTLTVAVVLLVVGSRRRWQRAWPAVVGAVLAGAVCVGSYAYPVAVEPLSHSFTPLPPGDLRQAIEALAVREGVSVGGVMVADASQRSTVMNAWISGMGPTRRVVLYDTLVDDAPQEVVLAVVAHELAHARYRHVETGTALGMAGAVMAVGLLGVVLGRRARGGRVHSSAMAQGVALVTLLAVCAQLASPVMSGVSRMMERQADASAVRLTGDATAYVELQVLLAERALADPEPPVLSHFWWGTHPTVLERVASARLTSDDASLSSSSQ